jgi:4-alpha-glucanotransferase
MKIHFYVRFYTRMGQSLAVTGNIAALGNDDAVDNAFPLAWLNNDYWHGTLEIDAQKVKIRYNYVLKNEDGYTIVEWGNDRVIDVTGKFDEIQVVDTWNHAGEYENVFYSDPFQNILLRERQTRLKSRTVKEYTHIFKVKAPLLEKNEVVCMLGSSRELGEWDTANPLLLYRENGWWSIPLKLPKESIPLQYKYGVYNVKTKTFIRYEADPNRILYGDADKNKLTILHDGFIRQPNSTWKGAGVSIPVFSLRSKNSFGTGEFPDLKLLVDWAKKTGLQVIQILPVNDTTATHTWVDTYPYAAISAFALHPLYLNLDKLAGKKYAELLKPLKKKQKQLNDLPEIEYEEVMKLKLAAIRELYSVQKEEFLQDKEWLGFYKNNKHWLIPYAAFCCLRDKYGTSDFNQWKTYSEYNKEAVERFVSSKSKQYDEVALNYFIQFHLHLQLKDAAEYAHQNGIILKGDIAIGVYRYGCDTWVEPQLYHMDMQAGAPPDDFAVRGQNWGFPTYNWERMAADGFEWWHKRFIQMSNYFDAFRIDHILGFFRIWSIPTHSVEGIMGTFVPAIPVRLHEFEQWGIWFNHQRYCKPFINDSILWEMFGPNKEKFKPFLLETGDGHYHLKPEFHTQRQVEEHFAALELSEDNMHIKQGLFDLISNLILFEHPGSNGQEFHFRISMDSTSSFRHLDGHTQHRLRELYVNYFYRRQDAFWMKEAMKKLPALKRSTNMLICGEDLGMVPHCVPDVMKQLGILSLEIQRMPKDPNREFFHPADAPYLSVVTPSTHDMSTVRAWWEEDRERTQRFFNFQLGQWGDAPYFAEAWINKVIIMQHLHSPGMWVIFQLQDWLGMSEKLRREKPQEERINVPANPKNYWRYRMHIPLEQLIKEKEFNEEIREYVYSSGRG